METSKFEKELDKNIKSGKISWESDSTQYYMVSKPALELVFGDWQPPKQLDIIPEFVEKWYNDNILYGTFSGVIASYAFNDNLDSVKWVDRNGGMELLCKMYLYGYTVVEKEKLYILKFPSQLYPYVSEVSVDNGITKQSKFAGSALKLTEKEIKAIDERYWQFAVMVDH